MTLVFEEAGAVKLAQNETGRAGLEVGMIQSTSKFPPV